MASQILHTLFGEDTIKDISVSFPLSAEYYPAFALGCQGPDIFYHSRRRRPVAIEYGTLLHRRGYGTFTAELLGRVLEKRPTALGWYALGFASHAFLDRAVHPYIVYKAGWVAPSKPETGRYARSHAFFERLIDSLMLELLRGSATAYWDQDKFLSAPCASPPEGLLGALESALRAAYPERAPADALLPQRLSNAFADAAGFYVMTNPVRTSDPCAYLDAAHRDRASVALVYPEGFPLGLDYLNLGKSEWRHPCAEGRTDRRSLPELYDAALDDAREFYRALFSAPAATDAPLPAVAELIGDGGLSIRDAQGKPCAPVHMDPLPLDEVLEGQYRRRLARLDRCGKDQAR